MFMVRQVVFQRAVGKGPFVLAWTQPLRQRQRHSWAQGTACLNYYFDTRSTAVRSRQSFQVVPVSTPHFSSLHNSNSNSIGEIWEDDTIFALSSGFTGQQATALAVIRISGPRAHDILAAMTPNKPLPKPRMATLRKLYYQNQMLDHALVLRFDAPNSFTGEDSVELQCHGSRAVVQGLLDALPKILDDENEANGGGGGRCRYAEAGEFTQRAYANGKLDLVQVEALADVLTADTQAQLRQALSQLDGKLSQQYDDWRQELIKGLAHAEAVIDFGDDEQLGMEDVFDEQEAAAQWNVWGDVRIRIQDLYESMQHHLEDDRRGELVREGVKIAIVGPPNAGKSSLFNVLAQQDAAIVSEIAGTTRDVLTVSLDLGGVKCVLQDTAGVRTQTEDVLELEGIRRAQAVAEKADLVVAMLDATEIGSGLETVQQVLESGAMNTENVLLVLNKLDLTTETAPSQKVVPRMSFRGTYEISCVTQQGVNEFLQALKSQVLARTMNQDEGAEGAMITRARHRQHVEAASEALGRFLLLSTQGTMVVDMAAEELRLATSELGRITGAVDVEDVLDVLFSDFCIGK